MADPTLTKLPTKAGNDTEIQIPEWDEAGVNKQHGGAKRTVPPTSFKASVNSKLDSVLPPHKRYVGLTRKTFLWLLLAVISLFLALITGLAAGLSSKSKYA